MNWHFILIIANKKPLLRGGNYIALLQIILIAIQATMYNNLIACITAPPPPPTK